MNKIGMLLQQLHAAETDLAQELRAVAERQAVEHDVYYLGHTLAKQCDTHAERLRDIAADFHADPDPPDRSSLLGNIMGTIQHKTSEKIGRRPEAGLLLLRDLRQLFLMAQEVNVHWLALGQVAQAVRDQALLDEVSTLHKQTVTQIKWLKTRLREATPQVMTVST